jgi:hypothetical protein
MTDTHAVSIELAVTADRAFAFMSDPRAMDRWSFGTWKIQVHVGGLVEGSSIFDGSTTWVKIDADKKRGIIDYHLGKEASALTPRIMARVIPGEHLDLGGDSCVLTMVAWRTRNMPDDRWKRLVASHEFEVFLLKSLIEAS